MATVSSPSSRLTARAQGEAQRLSGVDPELAKVAEMLDGAQIALGEASATLSRYRDALDLRSRAPRRGRNPDHEAARTRSPPSPASLVELQAHAQRLRAELETLQGGPAHRSRASSGRTRARAKASSPPLPQPSRNCAGATAERLGRDVGALLGELGMAASGRFEAQLETGGQEGARRAGPRTRRIPRQCEPGPAPRARCARSLRAANLSRISLADRGRGARPSTRSGIDGVRRSRSSGIGGAVAEVVGQKLRRLVRQAPVLCVTPSAPGRRAGPLQHLRVAKSSDGESTLTNIEVLAGNGRRDEIACCMLGGVAILARDARARLRSRCSVRLNELARCGAMRTNGSRTALGGTSSSSDSLPERYFFFFWRARTRTRL